MKFAYFYASSPEVSFPDIPTLPPLGAITSVEADALPSTIHVALNTCIVGLGHSMDFSLDVNIFFENEKVQSHIEIYEPFRKEISQYLNNEYSVRYSFIDSFTATEPGVYNFSAKLYSGPAPATEEEKSHKLPIHQTECCIVVIRNRGRNGLSS